MNLGGGPIWDMKVNTHAGVLAATGDDGMLRLYDITSESATSRAYGLPQYSFPQPPLVKLVKCSNYRLTSCCFEGIEETGQGGEKGLNKGKVTKKGTNDQKEGGKKGKKSPVSVDSSDEEDVDDDDEDEEEQRQRKDVSILTGDEMGSIRRWKVVVQHTPGQPQAEGKGSASLSGGVSASTLDISISQKVYSKKAKLKSVDGKKLPIVWALATLPNSSDVVSGDSYGQVSIWDGRTGTLLQEFGNREGDVTVLAVDRHNSQIYAGGNAASCLFLFLFFLR